MKLLKILFSRLVLTILLILIQLILFIIILAKFINYLPVLTGLSFLLSILFVLHLISKNENSSYKIAWIIVIMILPVFGGIIYLLFGEKRPAKKLNEKITKEHFINMAYLEQNNDVHKEVLLQNERAAGSSNYIKNLSSYPIYKNTSTKYYSFGEYMYTDMLDELSKADKFIFLEYFIISKGEMWDNILNILVNKAAKGVDVRIIYDDLVSLNLFTREYIKKLDKLNIKTLAFNPFLPTLSLEMNSRDHRKIMVIDGYIAFNGGINISDEYINKVQRFGIWKDTGLKLKGDAVWSFTLMFLETWNAYNKIDEEINNFRPMNYSNKQIGTDGYVQPYGDSPLDNEEVGENVYIDILNQAKNYVYVFTPYLMISDKMLSAFTLAAKRGVDVRIVTPGIPDKKIVFRTTRSYYRYLLESGVKIFEYTPGFLHAKSFVCDDEFAVVGTINLDYRSLYLHFECATLLYKTKSILNLKEDSENTIKIGKEITLNDCKQNFCGNLFNAILRLFAPLM